MDEGFASAILLKKSDPQLGSWDSIHIVQVVSDGKSAQYKLTSTILMEINQTAKNLGSMNLSGSLTRQAEQEFTIQDEQSHIGNIGRMIEDMETKMRNSIQDIYFGKTKDVVNELRSLTDLKESEKQSAIKNELAAKLNARKKL